MTSARQAAANRRNATKSAGPKTDAGKAAVALNAVKHGLLSKNSVLPDEDEAAFVEFGKRMRSDLNPVGELELLLADRIIASAWRLRRALCIEADVFRRQQMFMLGEGANVGDAFASDADSSDVFSKLSRYEAAIERALYKALHELQRLQAGRVNGVPVPVPAVLDIDVSGLPGA